MDTKQLEAELIGYCNYKKRVFSAEYNETNLKSIFAHRAKLLEKQKEQTDKEIQKVLGMHYAKGLLIPTDFDGVLLDADSVFAVAYAYDIDFTIHKAATDKFVLWVLFTNDPYLPVIPMVHIEHLSPLELILHKKKNTFLETVRELFPNLTYPICTLDKFEEELQARHGVRGKLDKEFMLGQLFDAQGGKALFEPMTITYEVGGITKRLLTEIGYTV